MKKIFSNFIVIAFIALCMSGLLSAQDVIPQDTSLAEKKDAYICDCNPGATNPGGSGLKLYQGPYYENSHNCFARSLLYWDIPTLPKDAIITKVTLQLKCTGKFGTFSGKMVFYRLTQTWNQSNVCHDNAPQYTPQDSASSVWPTVGQWISIDVTDLVKFWYAHPESNFGMLGHSAKTTTATGAAEFNSSRNSTDRPKLTIEYTIPVGVKSQGSIKPSIFNLDTYPNPFNPKTNISYAIDKPSWVSIKIFDMCGKQVDQVIREYDSAGEHRAVWNAAGFTSGVYFVSLEAGKNHAVKKLLLLK